MAGEKRKDIGILFTTYGENNYKNEELRPLLEKYFVCIENDNIELGAKELLDQGFSAIVLMGLSEDQYAQQLEQFSDPLIAHKFLSMDKSMKSLNAMTVKMLFNVLKSKLDKDEKKFISEYVPKDEIIPSDNKNPEDKEDDTDQEKEQNEPDSMENNAKDAQDESEDKKDDKDNTPEETINTEEKAILRYNVKNKLLHIGDKTIEVNNYVSIVPKEIAELLKKHYGFKEMKKCKAT